MLSLITGANGFIGSHLTRFLVEQGEQVRVLVRPQSDVRSLAGASGGVCLRGFARSRFPPRRPAGMCSAFTTSPPTTGFGPKIPRKSTRATSPARATCSPPPARPELTASFTPAAWEPLSPLTPGPCPTKKPICSLNDMIGHYKRSKFLAEQEALEAARQRPTRGHRQSHHPRGPGRLEANAHRPHHSGLS